MLILWNLGRHRRSFPCGEQGSCRSREFQNAGHEEEAGQPSDRHPAGKYPFFAASSRFPPIPELLQRN